MCETCFLLLFVRRPVSAWLEVALHAVELPGIE